MDGGGSGSRLNGGFRHRHAQNALCACITCSMRRPAPIFSAAFAERSGAVFGIVINGVGDSRKDNAFPTATPN